MAQHEGEIANLAHAYRVLDVPWMIVRSQNAFVNFNEVGNTSTNSFLGGAGAPPTFYFWTTDGNLTAIAPVNATAPEPSAFLLLASGLAALTLLRRRALQS